MISHDYNHELLKISSSSPLLKVGQSGPLSGSGSGPLEVGARFLKIKIIIALNVIAPMSSGSSCESEAGGQDALLAYLWLHSSVCGSALSGAVALLGCWAPAVEICFIL